ncbi:hypothetical protein ACL03H_09915 [Saccharopolyspora sp. MS10]|uniref:hypothetical protein n=1 Tax=Saccharopolyspora sp. MS10 TaxID=3385973 RepID=UPI0039A24C6B
MTAPAAVAEAWPRSAQEACPVRHDAVELQERVRTRGLVALPVEFSPSHVVGD